MNIKSRLTNYGLWIAIASLVPLLAQAFGFKLPANYANIINSILGILVIAGVLSNPTTSNSGFADDKPAETVVPKE